MKGIVFTEFMEMIEEGYGMVLADKLLQEAVHLPSKGIYTAVGTYDFSEMKHLLTALSTHTQEPPEKLLTHFGNHLFSSFAVRYADMFIKYDIQSTFDLMTNLDDCIHVEVHKLYPDATLPKFDAQEDENRLVMTYKSPRRLASLAEGLIESCIQYFKENIVLHYELMPDSEGQQVVVFTLTKHD